MRNGNGKHHVKRGRKPLPGLEEATMQTRQLAQRILNKYTSVERIELCALLGFTPSYLTRLAAGERNAAPSIRAKMQRFMDDPQGMLEDWTKEMRRKLAG